MKNALVSLSVLALVLVPAVSFAAVPCGQIDPATNQMVQCGNGPITPVTVTWGPEAVIVAAGTVVTDLFGHRDICPAWMSACVDISRTAYYLAHVTR